METKQRWALAKGEMLETCNAQDELIATRGDDHAVIVYRNGDVSNRYADGTLGITDDARADAESDDELYHPELDCSTSQWVNVIVDTTPGKNYGAFIRLAEGE